MRRVANMSNQRTTHIFSFQLSGQPANHTWYTCVVGGVGDKYQVWWNYASPRVDNLGANLKTKSGKNYLKD